MTDVLIAVGICAGIYFGLKSILSYRNKDWALYVAAGTFALLTLNAFPGLNIVFPGMQTASVGTTTLSVSKDTQTFSSPPVDQSWNQLFVIMGLVVVFIILIAAYFYWLHYVKKKKKGSSKGYC